MKKVLIVSVLSLFAGGVFAAGPLEFGVKAGLNSTNFDFKRNELGNSMYAFNKARTGYHAGVWMRLGFAGMFVQPEFLYNWNQYDMKVVGQGQGQGLSTSKIKVQTLEVPALVGWRVLILRLNAGPVFNLMNKTTHSGGVVQQADMLKPSISYTAGVGLDVWKISFDMRYNGLFERAKQTVEVDGASYPLRTNFRGWTFSLGWRL
jgi:hypothetical protein